MSIQDLGSLGELVGAAAVVVSIIYLAVQIKQNSRLVRSSGYQTAVQVAEPPAPPPLPVDAVDPETGEPDEAAYSAWLVEWLAYAEKYGEETPEDPDRV